jgi:hypothetical protein
MSCAKTLLPLGRIGGTQLHVFWSPDESCKIDVKPEFYNLKGDVILRTFFDKSYQKGRKIFKPQGLADDNHIQCIQTIHIVGH